MQVYPILSCLIFLDDLGNSPSRPDTTALENEFSFPNKSDSEEDLILNLANFLIEFNQTRRHGGLNYETPFDKLQKSDKITELVHASPLFFILGEVRNKDQ
ncbi:hypothetical protein MYX76_09030 [Desulfobacterota bacterium AH_259_B03_O07]|nr:hypothetical protein [Desulfobacterota bacterium AH_259_B03_O07]